METGEIAALSLLMSFAWITLGLIALGITALFNDNVPLNKRDVITLFGPAMMLILLIVVAFRFLLCSSDKFSSRCNRACERCRDEIALPPATLVRDGLASPTRRIGVKIHRIHPNAGYDPSRTCSVCGGGPSSVRSDGLQD